MNLTNILVKSLPVSVFLSFGVNKNVILKNVDTSIRRDENGLALKKNCFLTFSKIDPETKKIVAESTFSYFNIDKERPNYAFQNFIHQYTQLTEIMQAVVPVDKLEEALMPLFNVITDNQDLIVKIKTKKLKPKDIDEVVDLQLKISKAFGEGIKDFLGFNGDVVDLLVVTSSNGRFLDLPKEDKGFICKTGTKRLTIAGKYITFYENRNKVETDNPDEIEGEGDELMDEDMVLEDEQELDI